MRLGICMSFLFRYPLLAILSFLTLTCSNKGLEEKSHLQMVNILAEINDSLNPSINPYINSRRVAWLQAQQPGDNIAVKIQHRAYVAQEMLNAGYTPQAVEEFTRILTIIESQQLNPPKTFTDTIHDFLAIGYLRLSEEQNCLDQHTAESCIIPIRGSGIHRIKIGSKNAIREYEALLSVNPEDYNYRWLLNIAYMTLGLYPHEVPPQWLIPQLMPSETIDFPEFREIATLVGLDHIGLAGGAVMEDFDQDGFFDILVSSWGSNHQVKFFKNLGNGYFSDQTIAANLTGITGGLNTKPGDYNNDGNVDVLVLRGGWFGEDGKHPNSLLKNNGDGTFTDVTLSTGIFSQHPTQTAAWGDFNNDGWLDIFIGNETTEGKHPCELFRNNGDGSFTEIGAEAGLNVIGFVKAVIWFDMNNDGLLDLYISRLGQPNLLFKNAGEMSAGNWKFNEISEKAGVQEPIESFPVWAWDYNNDGWEDLFVSGYNNSSGDVAKDYMGLPHKGVVPRLYKNNGDNTFSDVALETGLNHPLLTMGCNYGDLNNDGYLDFYAGTGDPDFRSIQPNRMFLNLNGNKFTDVTFNGRFGHLQKGHGVAFGDLDNDGDQDVFSVIGGAYEAGRYYNVLFENPSTTKNSWIKIKLIGEGSNTIALGTRIEITTDTGRKIYRTVSSGSSFGASPLEQMIGLGEARTVKRLKIRWHGSDFVQEFHNLLSNKVYEIRESKNELVVLNRHSFTFPDFDL